MNDEIIKALQACLAAHWTAIETYASQAAHFQQWGYPKLAERAAADAEEERGHAKRLLERLEFFDQPAGFAHQPPSYPRHDYPGLLQANLSLESTAAMLERAAIQTARAVGDERTAVLLAENLEGSEASLRELAATVKVIAQIGLDNYLAAQV